MSFEYVGWRFNTTLYGERERLVAGVRALVCDKLNLCASVGCSCVTGAPGATLCHEHETAGTFALVQSQGPHWNVVTMRQPESILLAVYFEGPVLPHEIRALHLALTAYEIPMFQSTGLGSGRL